MKSPPERPAFLQNPLSIRCFQIAVLLVGYALALAFYPSIAAGAAARSYFKETYLGAIGASCFLSGIMLALRPGMPLYVAMALRGYVLIILGYSISAFLSAKLVLGMTLIAELACLLSWPASLWAPAGAICLFAAAQAWPHFFGTTILAAEIPRIAADQLAVLVFCQAFAALATAWLKRMAERDARMASSLRLQEANLESLAELNLNLQGYARTVDEESSERERARISREIHDISGYIFTNLIALMDAAGSMPRRDEAALSELLITARNQAQEGLRETRMALRKLRDREPVRADSQRAIFKIVSIFRKIAGIKVDLALGNLPHFLSGKLNLALYRTVQEALTNAIRHGKATAVRVDFWVEGPDILLAIADNGVGATDIVKGIGLRGMEERLGALGGSVRAGPAPEGGFSLSVRVPLGPDDAGA